MKVLNRFGGWERHLVIRWDEEKGVLEVDPEEETECEESVRAESKVGGGAILCREERRRGGRFEAYRWRER